MANVIKRKSIKSSKDNYYEVSYGVENCKYINTNGEGTQTLADKIESIDTNINTNNTNIGNIQDTLSNASTGLIKKVDELEEDFDNFKTSFQDGCNLLADKCAAYNVTLSANAGLSEISTAIETIAENQYNGGKNFVKGTIIAQNIGDIDGPLVKGKTGTIWSHTNNIANGTVAISIYIGKTVWEGSSEFRMYLNSKKIIDAGSNPYGYHYSGSYKLGDTLRMESTNGNTKVEDCIIILRNYD
jgi:hypothetical protein